MMVHACSGASARAVHPGVQSHCLQDVAPTAHRGRLGPGLLGSPWPGQQGVQQQIIKADDTGKQLKIHIADVKLLQALQFCFSFVPADSGQHCQAAMQVSLTSFLLHAQD